ncbi:MAG: glutamine--fructose-6-phosphate transaminase (isomerizing) [Solirubrobacteraceae bacterium]|nr:glutamine--fructose-6-phosphate transaminase (isomerizing) [Solirubrobacteraceae bacterium]
MCGIVGYVGFRPARDHLVSGLQKLEYRGYDSAGIALVRPSGVQSIRAVGNLENLKEAIAGRTWSGQAEALTGIGHTRWATHGEVTEENAHPHSDPTGRVQIVLNGIVENWAELRRRFTDRGDRFSSGTDAEVVAHLVADHYDGDLVEAVRRAFNELRGHYAFVAVAADEPDLIVAARRECPLVVGVGKGECFVASAIPAFLKETRVTQMVEDDEIVAIRASGTEFFTAAGEPVERATEEVDWDEETAEKGGFDTFMLKEIYEQPDAVAETIADRLIDDESVDLGPDFLSDEDFAAADRVVIVACGTSYHAGLIGRYVIENWARVPVEMDVASEYRYRDPVLRKNDVVIGITQSGETADTLAAMRMAREAGAKVVAVTNIMGSRATRDSDAVLFTRAGLEIGVAATKTFVSQVAAMYLIALKLAELKGELGSEERREIISELRKLPHYLQEMIPGDDERARKIAEHWWDAEFFLYLGRHVGLGVALEGALKLKEVSYIPTDAYAAGEMKHGPIALLDEHTPVVCIATDSPVYDKVASNIAEVRARKAYAIAVATEGNENVHEFTDEVLFVPRTHWLLQPLLAVVPLQLLAYHIATKRGLNVDQPRNLAKTVTVE